MFSVKLASNFNIFCLLYEMIQRKYNFLLVTDEKQFFSQQENSVLKGLMKKKKENMV